MDFGTCLLYQKQLGYEKSVELAAQAGFKSIDFGLGDPACCEDKDEEKYFGEMKKIAEKHGMYIGQTHAPFMNTQTPDPIVFTDGKFREKIIKTIRRTAILGSPYMVMHLFVPCEKDFRNVRYVYSDMMEENIKRNIEFCLSVKDYLKEYGVTMAIENIVAYDFLTRAHSSSVCSTSAECNRYIDALGDENFCVCLDAGHLNLVAGETHEQFIKALNGRVKVLHLHDNFGILNDWFGELDRHLPPFVGTLEWDKLAKALKDVNYKGVYSFEVSAYAPVEFAADSYAYIKKSADCIFGK